MAFFLSIGRFRYRKGMLEGWSFYVYKGTEKDNSKKNAEIFGGYRK